jgi:hypothetical protein
VRAEHYNYFQDYDPAIGRYVDSDPQLQLLRLAISEAHPANSSYALFWISPELGELGLAS